MNERLRQKKLGEGGFSHTFVWQDDPNAFYPDHTDAGVAAHIVIEGGMTLTSEGRRATCRPGERFGVPPGAIHSARLGARGCRYAAGEN